MIKKIKYLLQVIPKLGIANVAYIAYYRFSLKSGLRKKKFKTQAFETGEYFTILEEEGQHLSNMEALKPDIIRRGEDILNGKFTFYHHHTFNLGPIPDWFYDPFSEIKLNDSVSGKHWTEINEFDLNTGDIKNLWELSRFAWVTDLARAYGVTGNKKYILRLNHLIRDWMQKNPVNQGVSWRCGQETSIRVMRLLQAAGILAQSENISKVLSDALFLHLERIHGNIRYALAQDNNHGTSEAGVLYAGALWLLHRNHDPESKVRKQLLHFKERGRKLLEDRITKLIEPQGTFAQKSVNYHRVVLDTLSFVLYTMQRFDEPVFSDPMIRRLEQAGEWLLQMISNEHGKVPNIGANDGAMFGNLHSQDYRDFRPSLQLYFALLKNKRIWKDEGIDEPLMWYGLDPARMAPYIYKGPITGIRDNEFVQIADQDVVIRIIATQDNFRPGNDVLHLDVWHKGENILLDPGTYSYNSSDTAYFKSIRAHNSLQFGEGEPMPVISRFLNGAWVKVKSGEMKEKEEEIRWKGSYTDYRKNRHEREAILYKNQGRMEIRDQFESESNESKTLRFHLLPGYEQLLTIESSFNDRALPGHSEEGEHSLYYMQKRKHPVVYFQTTERKGTFVTRIEFLQ